MKTPWNSLPTLSRDCTFEISVGSIDLPLISLLPKNISLICGAELSERLSFYYGTEWAGKSVRSDVRSLVDFRENIDRAEDSSINGLSVR